MKGMAILAASNNFILDVKQYLCNMSIIRHEESNKINAEPIAGIITDRLGETYTIEVEVLTNSTQENETSILTIDA